MAEVEGILGRKLGMTSIFDPEGNVIPVTVIEAGPCQVVKKKTVESDRYNALQVSFLPVREKRVSKPVAGYYHKRGLEPRRFLREFRVSAEVLDRYEKGAEIRVDMFKPGDYVDVTGRSKGRGFAGVMKRHGFHGYGATHGTHEHFRHGGSVGANTFPARLWKGLGMPGHHGNERVTVQNLQVVQVIPDRNILMVRGAVPGPDLGLVVVRRAVKLRH